MLSTVYAKFYYAFMVAGVSLALVMLVGSAPQTWADGLRQELAAGVIHTYPDSPMDAADACGGPDGLAPARLASYLGHHLQQSIGSD